MNLLIFLVSVLFYLIFYFFYIVSNGKSIIWYSFSQNTYFSSLSWNLMIESISFVILWVFFYMYFSDFSYKKAKSIDEEKEKTTIINPLLKFIKSNNKYFLIIFITLFLSFFIVYLLYSLVSQQIIFYLFYLSLFFSLFIYFYLIKLEYFKINTLKLKKTSIILTYISIFLWASYLLLLGLNIYILSSLFILCLFNLYIHSKFENYLSFLAGIITINFIIYFLYYELWYYIDDGIIFLTLSLFVSIESILITYFYKFKYKTDYYFFHIFSYIINFLSLWVYLILFNIDLFILAVIFFMEIIYISLSYYKLKQIEKTY